MVLIAFAVRVSFLLLLRTYSFERADDYGVGEINNIAASIAKGLGFSSPFSNEYTGPTSWVAPVYPYFVALVFRFLGIMTHASIILIFTVQSLFSALTVIPILGIAQRTVGRRAGMWAAWTWILFPWFSKWAVTWLWEVSLSALLFSLLFWYALCLPDALSGPSGSGLYRVRALLGAQQINSLRSAVGFRSPGKSVSGNFTPCFARLVVLQLASAQKRLAQASADFSSRLHNRDFSLARA